MPARTLTMGDSKRVNPKLCWIGGQTVKLQTIRVKNFKNFTSAADGGFIEIALNGKSTVFYGNNGSGKSTLLSAVCYAAWPFINRLNNAQGTGYRTLDKEQLHIGQRSGSNARIWYRYCATAWRRKHSSLQKEMEKGCIWSGECGQCKSAKVKAKRLI